VTEVKVQTPRAGRSSSRRPAGLSSLTGGRRAREPEPQEASPHRGGQHRRAHRTGEAPIGSPINTFMGGGKTPPITWSTPTDIASTSSRRRRGQPTRARVGGDGADDVNDISIGIEIVNKVGDFPDAQYEG
jgi:hypothetical protein